MNTQTQDALSRKLSMTPGAIRQRQWALTHEPDLDKANTRRKAKRTQEKMDRLDFTRGLSKRSGFLKRVAHHLSKGRDAGAIACREMRRVSDVEAAIKELGL